MRLSVAGSVVFLFLSSQANAQDIRDQVNIQTGRAELVFSGLQPQNVANQVKEAVSQFAIPANLNFRSMPSEIPLRPDAPIAKQVVVRGTPAIEYHCTSAYAEITKRPPPVQNAFYFNAEALQACVYPFKNGVKVYLIFTTITRTEALTGGLFGGITKAIRGSEGERISGQLNENIDAIKKIIPALLIERIDVPGLPIAEPDKDAVLALIPQKQNQEQQPSVGTSSAQTTVAPTIATKIEARKNLTAMGMQYHSQEQFVAAIRRKDDVAVQLFLEAGGVDLSIKDKSGKSVIDIANDVGAADLAKLIEKNINTPSAAGVPAPIVKPVTQNDSSPTIQVEQNKYAAMNIEQLKIAAISAFSASEVAEFEASIEGLNLSPEKKEEFREQGLRKMLEINDSLRRLGVK